jgi:hypothetical protein
MRAQIGDTRFIASISEPVAKSGRRERLAPLSNEKCEVLRFRHGLGRFGQFREHRDIDRNRSLAPPERNDPTLNVLRAKPHHIAPRRHGAVEQFQSEPRARAERMKRSI